MYWLGYLNNGREAGEMTGSRNRGNVGNRHEQVPQWEKPKEGFWPGYLKKSIDDIANSGNRER